MEKLDKKDRILIILALIIVLVGLFFYIKSKSKQNSIEVNEIDFVDQKDEEKLKNEELNYEENDIMMVHISGAIEKPGVIEIEEGYRLIDAIKLSGGLLENADEDRINLAKRLSDEDKIYIPFIGEEIEEVFDNSLNDDHNNGNKININDCTKEELMTLPGIGDVTADKILEYRQETKFKSIEDIMSVSGIGDKKFEAIESLITIN